MPTAIRYQPERFLQIKMGSDESHFNVSLVVRGKLSHKTVSTNHTF